MMAIASKPGHLMMSMRVKEVWLANTVLFICPKHASKQKQTKRDSSIFASVERNRTPQALQYPKCERKLSLDAQDEENASIHTQTG